MDSYVVVLIFTVCSVQQVNNVGYNEAQLFRYSKLDEETSVSYWDVLSVTPLWCSSRLLYSINGGGGLLDMYVIDVSWVCYWESWSYNRQKDCSRSSPGVATILLIHHKTEGMRDWLTGTDGIAAHDTFSSGVQLHIKRERKPALRESLHYGSSLVGWVRLWVKNVELLSSNAAMLAFVGTQTLNSHRLLHRFNYPSWTFSNDPFDKNLPRAMHAFS